jgi:ABC-type nitrate/sulfonate/bicarbonate transport system substrate-binding protein
LAAAWMNTEGAEIEVTYDKDFNEDDISEQLMKSFVDIRRNRDLSRETFLRLLHQWGWMPEDFDVEQEIDRIAEETRNESRTVGRLGGGLMTTREQQSGQTA